MNKVIAVYDNTVSARTYLSYIAEQAGGFACIGRDRKLYIKTIGENTVELDIEKFQDFVWGEQFKVSRVAYEDGIQDFKFGDETNNTVWINQENMYIVDEEQVENIYNNLKDFECCSFEGNSIIDPSLDVGDIVVIDGKNVIFQGDMDYLGKFKASISSKIQAKSKEETMTRIPSQKVINRRVESRINQQDGIIEQTVSEVSEQNNKISKITQTVDELNSKISNIADVTITGESLLATVSLDNINKSEPVMVKIHPISYGEISYLYPRYNLYPEGDLYPRTRTLRFKNKTTNEIFDYEIPYDLYSYDNDNYDEFILDYENNEAYINKKVSISSDGMPYLLDVAEKLVFDYPLIELTDGDYTVYLVGYETGYIFVRLMTKNIYTTQFATKVEVSSDINQSATEIALNVDKKLTSYTTREEVNSAISITSSQIKSTVSETYETKSNATTNYSALTQKADSISSEVSKKVGNDEIISKINQSAEAVSINANKISLSGKEINLTGENTTIDSNYLHIDKYGTIALKDNGETSTNLNITGGVCKAIYGSWGLNMTNSYTGYGSVMNSQQVAIIDNAYGDASNVGVSMGLAQGGYPEIYLHTNSCKTTITDSFVKSPTITQTSQESIKKHIKKYKKKALAIIKESEIYEYNFKSDKDISKKKIGFVIGDLGGNYKTPDEIISDDGEGINTYNMTSILWKAVQEQQQIIEKLQKEIREMKEEK